MADAAGPGPGRLAGRGGFPVAADAQVVHDLPYFERPVADQAVDAARLLRKERMTCLAGYRFRFLVLPVRKENRALDSGVDHDLFRPVVRFRRRVGTEGCREKQYGKARNAGHEPAAHDVAIPASPVSWQDAKSIGFPQDEQV